MNANLVFVERYVPPAAEIAPKTEGVRHCYTRLAVEIHEECAYLLRRIQLPAGSWNVKSVGISSRIHQNQTMMSWSKMLSCMS